MMAKMTIHEYAAKRDREARCRRALATMNQVIRIYEAWLAQIEKQKEDAPTPLPDTRDRQAGLPATGTR